jgi:hypothetical protein
MIVMENIYLTQDAGIFMSAFLASAVDAINKIIKGEVSSPNISIKSGAQNIVVTSSDISTEYASYVMKFTINKTLQMIQVRLIDTSDKSDITNIISPNEEMDLNGQVIKNLSFIGIKLNGSGVDSTLDYVKSRIQARYASSSNAIADTGFISQQMNRDHLSFWDVVTNIIKETVQYAVQYPQTPNTTKTLPNGMMITYYIGLNGELQCDINFGEFLMRAVKNDALFV